MSALFTVYTIHDPKSLYGLVTMRNRFPEGKLTVEISEMFSACSHFSKIFKKYEWPDIEIDIFVLKYPMRDIKNFVFPEKIIKIFIGSPSSSPYTGGVSDSPIYKEANFPVVHTLHVEHFESVDIHLSYLSKKMFWNKIKKLEISQYQTVAVRFSDWPENLDVLTLETPIRELEKYEKEKIEILYMPETITTLEIKRTNFEIDFDRLPVYLRVLKINMICFSKSEKKKSLKNVPPLLEKLYVTKYHNIHEEIRDDLMMLRERGVTIIEWNGL